MRPLSLTPPALCVLLTVAACGNAPQQPRDVVDDRSAESPYAEAETDLGDEPTGDGIDEETTGSVSRSSGAGSGGDAGVAPVATGAKVAQSGTFSQIAGRWAATANSCSAGGDYVISADRVERPGQVCSVAELIDAGSGSVTAALLCPSGEVGTQERELLRLTLEQDALNVNVVGSRNPPQTLQRCSP